MAGDHDCVFLKQLDVLAEIRSLRHANPGASIEDVLAMAQRWIESMQADRCPANRDWYIQRAIDEHHEDGKLEIDDTAVVSTGEQGAYVQAWLWVDAPEHGA
jgi:hypothetical protein